MPQTEFDTTRFVMLSISMTFFYDKCNFTKYILLSNDIEQKTMFGIAELQSLYVCNSWRCSYALYRNISQEVAGDLKSLMPIGRKTDLPMSSAKLLWLSVISNHFYWPDGTIQKTDEI